MVFITKPEKADLRSPSSFGAICCCLVCPVTASILVQEHDRKGYGRREKADSKAIWLPKWKISGRRKIGEGRMMNRNYLGVRKIQVGN